MTEPFSEKEMQAIYLRVIQEFKYKKLEIDKKLDEIVNKKITKIEKDCKKFKEGILYFGNGYNNAPSCDSFGQNFSKSRQLATNRFEKKKKIDVSFFPLSLFCKYQTCVSLK